MRKFVFALTVLLLVAPAWATVYITCTSNLEEVTVSFDARSEADPNVRAFALNVTADSGANIVTMPLGSFVSDFTDAAGTEQYSAGYLEYEISHTGSSVYKKKAE